MKNYLIRFPEIFTVIFILALAALLVTFGGCQTPIWQTGGSVSIVQTGGHDGTNATTATQRAGVDTKTTETASKASHPWLWILGCALGGVAILIVLICLFTNQTPLSLVRALFKLAAL